MHSQRQSGFIMMIMVVIMVVGAIFYFSRFNQNLFQQNLSLQQQASLNELLQLKNKILTYAAQYPEIYTTTSGNNPIYYTFNKIPGPGYLPCPDNVGLEVPDGEMSNNCQDTSNAGFNGFIYGFLPHRILGRNIFFSNDFYRSFAASNGSAKRYYWVVHEQFVMNNPKFLNTVDGVNMNRYAPLNSQTPIDVNSLLSLNGNQKYIALLIAPGNAQTFPDNIFQNHSDYAPQNFLDYGVVLDNSGNLIRQNGNVQIDNTVDSIFETTHATNSFNGLGINDVIVGISLEEWQTTVFNRVSLQKENLCLTDPNEATWFNAYDALSNPVGQGWREVVCP